MAQLRACLSAGLFANDACVGLDIDFEPKLGVGVDGGGAESFHWVAIKKVLVRFCGLFGDVGVFLCPCLWLSQRKRNKTFPGPR